MRFLADHERHPSGTLLRRPLPLRRSPFPEIGKASWLARLKIPPDFQLLPPTRMPLLVFFPVRAKRTWLPLATVMPRQFTGTNFPGDPPGALRVFCRLIRSWQMTYEDNEKNYFIGVTADSRKLTGG